MKLINYDELLHEALRGFIRDLLARIQEKGLPGEHHFYISFKTSACQIAPWLKKRYPEEMTVILQKQYEALVVEKDKFAVTLYFDSRPERIIVPFSALTGFADPHASFSLRMVASDKALEADNLPATAGAPAGAPATTGKKETAGQVVELDAFRKQK